MIVLVVSTEYEMKNNFDIVISTTQGNAVQ